MTPQEKAKDIFVKMLESIPDYLIKDNTDAASISKIHALIAVDEILKSGPTKPGSYITIYQDEREAHDFWQQVKTEIEKL